MRHVVVTRAVLLFGAGLAGACLLFARHAPSGPRSAPPASSATTGEGARLFEARCAACHEASDLAARAARAARETGPDAARAELRRFLAGHGHARPDEDAAIAEFLATAGGG